MLKFSRTGKFLRQIGKAGEFGTGDSRTSLNRPAAIAVDTAVNEVFIADGGTSQRVVVFDAMSGTYLRHWVQSEKLIQRTAVLAERGLVRARVKPFARLSSIVVSRDGRVYVGDRQNNDIHVFERNGTPVTFGFVPLDTGSLGSV